MTRAQLLSFIRRRNAGGWPVTALEFRSDCRACGFAVRDLGPARYLPVSPGVTCWYWRTRHGILAEVEGRLTLHRSERAFWRAVGARQPAPDL